MSNRKISIKVLLVLFVLMLVVSLIDAHEFWLQSKIYHYKLGEEVKVHFMVGESFTGEYWDLTQHKAEKVELRKK
jgi:uncharacterized GH25 family protein